MAVDSVTLLFALPAVAPVLTYIRQDDRIFRRPLSLDYSSCPIFIHNMAKSKRSKVKMAYKAMRRAVMEPHHDAKLREQAGKVYDAIGLPMPEERSESAKFKPRFHGGSELVSTFAPTPKGPKLNAVHGPLARDAGMQIPEQVVGFPIVGAAERARKSSGRRASMDVDEEEDMQANTPYFYPRRSKKSGPIQKKRRDSKTSNNVKNVKRKAKKMDTKISA